MIKDISVEEYKELCMKYILTVVQGLVDHPDSIRIKTSDKDSTVAFEIYTDNKMDLGYMIGRRGRNVEALRTLVHSFSIKYGRKGTVEICEEI
jgi:predicted RNA-binding protein YlqC (UPF0109 family)